MVCCVNFVVINKSFFLHALYCTPERNFLGNTGLWALLGSQFSPECTEDHL